MTEHKSPLPRFSVSPFRPEGTDTAPTHPRVYFALGLMGFITALAQITFLRRGIANFSGNELSLAIGLFAWLAWVGLGSLLSRLLAFIRFSLA